MEAGKKAAAGVLALQAGILAALGDAPQSAEQVAVTAGSPEAVESVFLILEHLAANGRARAADEGGPDGPTFRRVVAVVS